MGFNPTNSARSITQGLTEWKSRSLIMSSRVRGTGNFGDIMPLYWAFTLPNDKMKCDSKGVFKFMPLYAPALVDCKVQFDWFWVPLKLIAPQFRKMLQNWSPSSVSSLTKSVSNPFDPTNGFNPPSVEVKDQDMYSNVEYRQYTVYPPSLPAKVFSEYLCDYTINSVNSSDHSRFIPINPNGSFNTWRNTSEPKPGFESVSSYIIKKRNSKLMGYLGLPKILTTLKYNKDVVAFGTQTSTGIDYVVDNEFSSPLTLLTTDFLNFTQTSKTTYLGSTHKFNTGDNFTLNGATAIYFPPFHSIIAHSTQSAPYNFTSLVEYNFPLTNSTAPVSLLPFQAYQTIYNKFYRDQKIMKDEIRTYSNCTFFPLQSSQTPTFNSYSAWFSELPFNGTPHRVDTVFFNNLCGLRRKNYAKDLFSTCFPDTTILINNQSDPLTSSNISLLAKFRKFSLKKEMTGSSFFQFLNNFFGTRGSDYLTDNVVHLGSHEDQVIISENIQNSESSSSSAQGNRAGLANAYHSDKEVYFEAPDFGVLMCNVTLVPDFPTPFTGLDPRWSLVNPVDWNFVDLQNIGFTTVYNHALNLGVFEKSSFIPSGVIDSLPTNDTAFGYQPFGYAWTYQPDNVCGDLRGSLYFWLQSPDYSLRNPSGSLASFTSDIYPSLNLNYPAIGRRFLPGSPIDANNDLSYQYYNNIFAVTNDESGDHCIFDINFDVTFHRKTAFFTDGLPESN